MIFILIIGGGHYNNGMSLNLMYVGFFCNHTAVTITPLTEIMCDNIPYSQFQVALYYGKPELPSFADYLIRLFLWHALKLTLHSRLYPPQFSFSSTSRSWGRFYSFISRGFSMLCYHAQQVNHVFLGKMTFVKLCATLELLLELRDTHLVKTNS